MPREITPEELARSLLAGLALLSDDGARLDVLTATLKRAFCDGVAVGVRRYAWWCDGTQFVGTCGQRLDAALGRLAEQQTRWLASREPWSFIDPAGSGSLTTGEGESR